MTTAVVAEKPSVARDIAAALGATRHGAGCFEGNNYVVTWAIGHLVALAEPGEIDPAWKRWSLATLPMLPTRFPLVVVPGTRDQFAVIRRILAGKAVTRVICATDAGREGELIFRYIYEATGCTKPVSRLWISSLTRDAILHGLAHLRSSADYDGLADAARGRSRADWLVGMNLSRAYSLALDQDISVGRVQTPTLALLVERELAIREFVPEDYREVVATFKPRTDADSVAYVGTWFRPPIPGAPRDGEDPSKRRRLPPDGVEADAIVARARTGAAEIASVKAETKSIPPPLLYDLTELQRHANRLYGLSAQKTLDIAQALYERHKLISYPRTDSRHLSQAVAATLPGITAAVAPRYPGLLAPGTGQAPLGRRFVDDARVTDHHAILPTSTPARQNLSADEQKIYDLICRRLLAAWHDDHVYASTTVITTITTKAAPAIVDHYESRGTAVEKHGWKVLDIGYGKPPAKPRAKPDAAEKLQPEQALPPGLVRGQPQQVLDARSVAKQTKPPPRHNEATLLTAMETAGKLVDDKELSDAMRDQGLGTPATRAQIIETLLRREYVVRDGKTLSATDKGIHLISVVHPEVKSPAMTGEWEAKLKRMARGDGDLPTFMSGIESFITDVVGRVTATSRPAANTRPTTPRPDPARAPIRSTEHSPTPRPSASRAPIQSTEHSPAPRPSASRARVQPTEHSPDPQPSASRTRNQPTEHSPEPRPSASHTRNQPAEHSPEPRPSASHTRNQPTEHTPDPQSSPSRARVQPTEHSPDPRPSASHTRNQPTEHTPDPQSSPSRARVQPTEHFPAPRSSASNTRNQPTESFPEPPPWLDELWPDPQSEYPTEPARWPDDPWLDTPADLPRARETPPEPSTRLSPARKQTTARAPEPAPAEPSPEPTARASRSRKKSAAPSPEPATPATHSPEPVARASRSRKTTPPLSPEPSPNDHSLEPTARTARPRSSPAHASEPALTEHSLEPAARTARPRSSPAHASEPALTEHSLEPTDRAARPRSSLEHLLEPAPTEPAARASRSRKQTPAHTPEPALTEHSIEPAARASRKKTPAHAPEPAPTEHSLELPRASRSREKTPAHAPEPAPTEHSPEPAARPSRARTRPTAPPPEPSSASARTPTAADDLRTLLRARFGFPEFRPYQEAVCRAATQGRDVLLVMPTGAGKSLCYQLPGLARAGTTLIISPLIALMEDQAAKLAAQGFRAERIHSGRGRGDSRQACIDYLEGNLDYLFIAPERLRVPGFPEMLARRKPTLIAIDEAHCISQWGHDFRPDYRTLGQRLPALRPAPIVALTATATPTVQDDIAAQLGLQRPGRFIHGFRRTNIAIEVVERSPGERTAAIRELLADPARRPAIVYAATRKSTEELADALGPRLAAAYHAGMSNTARDEVQSAFLSGRRDVIVATTAFGMGIDKPDVRTILHAALPGSLEGYYQEIGRAGRDGAPATAILLHARVDLKTHEFFHARDYPDPRDLAAIYNKLPGAPTPRESLNKRRGRDARDKFENALEKLIVHGGALESDDEQIIKGASGWAAGYNAQRAHKLTQLQDMAAFAASRDCRMVHLIRHFGDAADGGAPCGICDVCAPTRTIADDYKKPSPHEKTHQARILAALADSDGLATGRLHRDNFGDELDRKSFEHVLGGLVAMGLVEIERTSFTKRRKLIPFERATLTPAGHAHELTAAGLRLPTPKPAKKATRKATSRRTRKPTRKTTAKRTTTAKRRRGAAAR